MSVESSSDCFAYLFKMADLRFKRDLGKKKEKKKERKKMSSTQPDFSLQRKRFIYFFLLRDFGVTQ